MQINELTQEHGEIIIHDSFECELGKHRAIPYSQFIRGIIAGILAELFGKRFNVVEEECIAKHDPACRLSIKPLQMHIEKVNLKSVKTSSSDLGNS
ncbi:MAG: V4R domain-containing protein [Candidatus Methanomethylicaceae archaeon]